MGNKSDMTDQVEVQFHQGVEYGKKIGSSFTEVSAKENIGITELFTEIGQKLHKKDIESANAA